MLKLKLDKITKTYQSGEKVTALNGISLGFRKNELVSILGPSGCGKTSLLNIIGGLDHYDSGDLLINGLSTEGYRDSDWDLYRNRSIGFVFQSYNLISHQTVLQNVEIALTLSGISASTRKSRAEQALIDVGLADQIYKKPNQLSGGQMQRVAIARALVNDPDIILADEPTGALDSKTSLQIMEILKEISQNRLVIMVTHNPELAESYSSRTIRILDGAIQSDSNPVSDEEINQASNHSVIDDVTQLIQPQKNKSKKTSMSVKTASSLSFKNLLTKKGRTFTTAIAGSVGIIGVALVLALSNGLSLYMEDFQSTSLSDYPISISTRVEEFAASSNETTTTAIEYPEDNILLSHDKVAEKKVHTNIFTSDYLSYIEKIEAELPDAVNDLAYTRGLAMNVLAKSGDSVVRFETAAPQVAKQGPDMLNASSSYWQELPDNDDFIHSMYDLIGEGSRLPQNKNEVLLVVDEYNRIDKEFLSQLAFSSAEYKLTDFIGKTFFSVILNNEYYRQDGDLFIAAPPADYQSLYDSEKSVKLTITGILRVKKDVSSTYLSPGIAYTSELTNYLLEDAKNSDIASKQKNSTTDLLVGGSFENEAAKKEALLNVGADTTPTGVNIYPKDYASKDEIRKYLNDYNKGKTEVNKVIYTDMAESLTSMLSSFLDAVTYVLTGFAAISLLVSTIMIGIITYVSVVERTKEIGILRSVGARKRDISRLFNAEAIIIGLMSGAIGIFVSYLLILPINMMIKNMAGLSGIANLNPVSAIALILGSMLLTLIASFFPSRMAAEKDPVEALRTE